MGRGSKIGQKSVTYDLKGPLCTLIVSEAEIRKPDLKQQAFKANEKHFKTKKIPSHTIFFFDREFDECISRIITQHVWHATEAQ